MKLKAKLAALAATVALGWSLSAGAVPLGLTPSDPDILVSDLSFSYDGVGTLTVEETLASFFEKNPGSVFIGSGDYSLVAPIDPLTGLLSGPGSLSILGDIGAGVTTLLAGAITDFGFSGSGTAVDPLVLEFLVSITASEPSFGYGSTAGIILTSSNVAPPLTGLPLPAHSGTGNSNNFNVAAVPEPSLIMLLGIGGTLLTLRLRQRSGVENG